MCCLKGSTFQKLYIVDPTDGRRVDSLKQQEAGEVVSILPFWNAVGYGAHAANLQSEMLTVSVTWCTTVKNDGFKGVKPPVKLEMKVPILTNGEVIEAGQLIAGPATLLERFAE